MSPAPNSRAITLSRTNPVTRLIITATETIPADRTTVSCFEEDSRTWAIYCSASAKGFTQRTQRALLALCAGFLGVRCVNAAPLASVFFKKVGNRHDPRIIIRELVLFIRRMQAVIRQPESHQDGRNAQVFGEIPDNRNRSAAAHEHSVASQNILERPSGHIDRGVIRIHHDRRAR